MAGLSQETIKLLDRLFNLKSEDSVIIKGIEEQIAECEQAFQDESATQIENEVAKADAAGKLKIFEMQRDIFITAFADVNDETFSALRDIGVNIEIGTMMEIVQEKAPSFCDELEKEISKYEEAINNNKSRKEKLSHDLAEYQDSKNRSLADRDKLISLLEQSLSTDEMERESLSASFVKKVLGIFDMFSPDEINTLTKLIIFPDDGLFDYANGYEERAKNGFVFEEEAGSLGEEEKPLEEDTHLGDDLGPVVPEVEPVLEEDAADKSGDLKEEEPKGEIVVGAEEVYGEEKKDLPVIDSAAEEASVEEAYGTLPKDDILSQATTILDLSSLNAPADDHQEDLKEVHFPEESHVGEPEDEIITLTSDKPAQEGQDGEDGEKDAEADVSLEEDKTEVEEPVPEKNEVEEYLASIGIDVDKLASINKYLSIDLILSLFKNVSHKLIEENYELLRSINVSQDTIYTCAPLENGNHLYLTDADLSKKITALRAKGISEHKTRELVENMISGLRLSYDDVMSRLNAIESAYGKVSDDNVSLIGSNVELFDNNCKELASFGIELDEKELNANSGILFATRSVPEDLKVLKSYLISLVRKNGKYALTPFWKDQYQLLTDIDDLVEADLDGVVEQSPEVLGENVTKVIERADYCLAHDISLYDEDDKTLFADYITDYSKFYKKYGMIGTSLVIDREDVNSKLPELIGNEDYVGILTSILADFYKNSTNLVEVNMDLDVLDNFDDLKAQAMEKLEAEETGKYTLKVGGVTVSKNKFERHLAVLLNALATSEQNISGVEREILLTALLYNLRKDDETLMKVVNAGLGFNVNVKALGGNNL